MSPGQFWVDWSDARVLAVIGARLVALNAKTGERYPAFGDGGEVDLIQGYDDRTVESFRWRSAPLVVNDVIVIGSAISDITSATMPALKEMPPGDVRGYDVRTGEQLWIFHTIAREGEPVVAELERPGGTTAAPISYIVDGKQYLAS